VGDLLDNQWPGVFKAYTGALEKLLAYQTQQAKALSSRPASSRAAARC
jgi:methyl-accepting chemotaxis protein